MSQTTTNSSAFIHTQQYSNFVVTQLPEHVMSASFSRNVSDFSSGSTLNIKTLGVRTLQDVTEDEDLTLNKIDSNTITLTISNHVGDAMYVTDELYEDGDQVERLLQESAMETARLIDEEFESTWLQAAHDAQTAANANNVNGFSHRFRATGGNQQMTEADFISMALAFDKAKVPMAGRIAIVDPVVAATFNRLATTSAGLDRTPQFMSTFLEGFKNAGHKFVMNIFGWDVWTSNLLPDIAAGTSIDGTNTLTNAGKANIFMCIADDNIKPMMSAWRRKPRTRSVRVESKGGGRDEFYTTARWGHGSQRKDTLGIIATDGTAVA